MGRKRSQPKPLDTIWEVSDALWARIEPILQDDWKPSPKGGQPPANWRALFNGILHRLRSGCQWNRLPKEYPDDSSVHRTFQRWVGLGVFDRIWAVVQEACEDLGGCDWEWQAADTSMGKARMGGISSGPTRPTAPSLV